MQAGPAARAGVSRQRVVSVSAAVKAKATAKSAAYVCLECGYLYTGSEPFESLKNYACPVCAAPKRRCVWAHVGVGRTRPRGPPGQR